VAHSSRTYRGRSPIRSKRTVTWDAGPSSTIVSVTGASKNLFTTGIALNAEAETTIVRTRGEIFMQLDLVTAAGDGFNGAVGLGIVTSDAFGAGTAAVPGPFGDPSWDGWFFHQYWTLRGIAAQSQGADVPINAPGGTLRIPIDSKAMRKFKSNETIFGMIEVAVETGTAGLIFRGDTRQLHKLS